MYQQHNLSETKRIGGQNISETKSTGGQKVSATKTYRRQNISADITYRRTKDMARGKEYGDIIMYLPKVYRR